MTYQPNPDAPIASEQHPELYERMCKARNFIEEVLTAYVKARKANGMTRPVVFDLDYLEQHLSEDIRDQFNITNLECFESLGEGYQISHKELEQLIEENWNGK